jgi:lysophospholipase L1-like esterase
MNKSFALILLLFSMLVSYGGNKKHILPNDNNIGIKGAFFLQKSDKKVIINRISPKILDNPETYMRVTNVNTQSGVRISVNTNSENVTFLFEKRENAAHRFSVVGIYKNGELFKKIMIKPKNEKLPDFSVTNPDGNKWTEWTLVLPPYYGMNFLGVDIDENSEYKGCKGQKKPVYVAIGNSITHGTGQNAGYETYDYRLAEMKGWELYNVAVGGSKISWPIGKMLKKEHIDVITILWGYNDWNAGFTPEEEIIPRYSKLLELLTKHHPEAKIYCILPTATKAKTPKRGNLTLDDIRNAEKKAAEAFLNKGNKNIVIINGEDISDVTFLRDKVHFTVEGAEKFAENLAEIIH